MKSFEQLVKEYYEPAPKEDVGSLLFEMVEDTLSQQEERASLEMLATNVVEFLRKEGYVSARISMKGVKPKAEDGRGAIEITDLGWKVEREKAMRLLVKEYGVEYSSYKKGFFPNGVRINLVQGTVTGGADVRISNSGDIAEGILGAAIYTALQRYPKKTTDNEVRRAIQELGIDYEVDGKKAFNSLGATTSAGVPVTLDVGLNTVIFRDLVDEEKRFLLDSVYSNVMRFVRSRYFMGYMKRNIYEAEPSLESLRVAVVGAADQLVAKSDIHLFRNEEILWKYSLKKDSRQLSQVGGKKAENVFGYLADIFGFSISDEFSEKYEVLLGDLNKKDYYKLSQTMFEVISSKAKQKAASNPDEYVKQILESLKKAAISDESNIDLLNFEKNRFRLLGFDDIIDRFKGVSFCSGVYTTSKGGVPYLVVYDASDGSKDSCPVKRSDGRILFTVRPKWEAGPPPVLRYYLEYGELMDTYLTRVAQQ